MRFEWPPSKLWRSVNDEWARGFLQPFPLIALFYDARPAPGCRAGIRFREILSPVCIVM